ncbi:MAG: 1-acyl-sn-glycerol-3-phosphate acyltransferase [Acholeplasmataceae bacterium]|nr:1-acyl-sn-glycerol-3-phosphate acyltransferase [Acholeplasmataceae bacterium]
MISIIFTLVWLSSTYFLTILVGNYYLIPVWMILSYIIGLFSTVLFLYINLPIMKYTKVNNPYKVYVTRSMAAFMNHFVMRLKISVQGLENVPKDGKLTIYANHKSYADPFIIMDVVNFPMTVTPKMSVYKLPLIGLWLKYLGAFPIDRSSDRNTARAMVDAIKVVKEGMGMLIFPEGGIKDRNAEKMVAMRAGAYRVAMKAGADMLPISLQNTTNIKYRAPFRSTHVKVVIHPVIHYEDIKHLQTAEIADRIFHVINDHLFDK